jgi:predicted metal-dependent hydrolase
VTSKLGWITQKISQMQTRLAQVESKKLQAGAEFLWLGKTYLLKFDSRAAKVLQFKNDQLISKYQLTSYQPLELFYRQSARSYLGQRVKMLAQKHHFNYRQLRVTNAQTRWGSCSQQNNLNFSWRLLMAPFEVVDYVIIHELAHTVEKNHSQSFWQLVEKCHPAFKQDRHWLKENGNQLAIDKKIV